MGLIVVYFDYIVKGERGNSMRVEMLPALQGDYNLHDYASLKRSFSWDEAQAYFSWNQTNKVNIAYEAIDKHAESDKKDKIALLFSDVTRNESYTFLEMKRQSNKVANVLKEIGINKGDRVFTFMPRCPELYFSLFGILKVGAIVGPMFQAFQEEAVRERLFDSGAKAVFTTPQLLSRIPVHTLPNLEHIIVIGENVNEEGPILDYSKRVNTADDEFEIEWVDLEDGMILHYTSESMGEPKGIYHVHHAMLQLYMTAKWVLDLKENDVYWCTADPGWITGTAYGVFAPWLLGTTNVILGGRFNPSKWYEAIETYDISVWYSAPTAFRMLMGAGDELAKQYNLHSLRHILTVGEPLNPEVIRWGMKVLKQRIHDTWWMTETGAIMISNFPSMNIKPGSMGKPLPGITAAIVDDFGEEVPPNHMGNIAIKRGWPAMMRKIWNDEENKYTAYFTKNDWFLTGDSGYMDDEGYFWFQGRIDDVIMTSGERVGPFEVESKLLEHPAVAEAGVIGKPDPARGEVIKAFVSLKKGYHGSPELEEEIKRFVQKALSVHAAPREIEFREKLPKTKSGKIIRRVLKAWELNLPTDDVEKK